ncbi:TPA: phosphopantothenate--cysteine ligase [Streptococcus mutans]|uniref:phosphopantothenate--cysteine ligase n=1 Tax=Streptococcus mutans TaxID=1309 RepID=UPI0002B5606A|nr:phosphopantothenate--cysteine ligase [Streptococcus mutans]ARS62422.1 phosphopantothenate--cysteine ligase [Streptococcus mutans]EMB59725.1 phosphopantothenate--cysteine ligase [Streptococcus mutans 15JP3]EMC01959.1 phosphopantothenate--cysteine ligase [Streptococcus mutans T4]EMC27361.1 phosphopantothenate--cysteine ligase [Streptococcus mutans ST6]ESS17364.1 putative flavoprotein involved in panthothenate metabolism [Streptococcus mutans PKUSS-HG01]
MKILITSGGTTEKIDQVRGITNHSSGRLGKKIAEKFLAASHQVTLVTTASAIKPKKRANLSIIEITDVNNLIETLEPLVKSHHVLIHSMAVSDYTPIYMTDLIEVEETSDLSQLLTKTNKERKISSQADYQVLFLKKTPKVISLVKQWNPSIQLIAFKLLVNVSKEELFQVARSSLKKNQADYILANDLTMISADKHLAYLLDDTNAYMAETKAEIADLIFEKVRKND